LLLPLAAIFAILHAAVYLGMYRPGGYAGSTFNNSRVRPADNNHLVVRGIPAPGFLREVKILESSNPDLRPGMRMPLLVLQDRASRRPEQGFVYELSGRVIEVKKPADHFRPLSKSFMVSLIQMEPYLPSDNPVPSNQHPPGLSRKEWEDQVKNIIAIRSGIPLSTPAPKAKNTPPPKKQVGVEKFAAADTVRNSSDPSSSEIYTIRPGRKFGRKDAVCPPHDGSDHGGQSASWVYHSPTSPVKGSTGSPMGDLLQVSEDSRGLHLWVETNHGEQVGFYGAVYYRYDGKPPSGEKGSPSEGTLVMPLKYSHSSPPEIGRVSNGWWTADPIRPPQKKEILSYRIGVWRK